MHSAEVEQSDPSQEFLVGVGPTHLCNDLVALDELARADHFRLGRLTGFNRSANEFWERGGGWLFVN